MATPQSNYATVVRRYLRLPCRTCRLGELASSRSASHQRERHLATSNRLTRQGRLQFLMRAVTSTVDSPEGSPRSPPRSSVEVWLFPRGPHPPLTPQVSSGCWRAIG
jgi:hypothetical protein